MVGLIIVDWPSKWKTLIYLFIIYLLNYLLIYPYYLLISLLIIYLFIHLFVLSRYSLDMYNDFISVFA
jgi:hypothetical protein